MYISCITHSQNVIRISSDNRPCVRGAVQQIVDKQRVIIQLANRFENSVLPAIPAGDVRVRSRRSYHNVH